MLDLLDYRHKIFDLYRDIHAAGADPAGRDHFQRVKDDIFLTHPQSALNTEQQAAFTGLEYYDYDPAYRVTAKVDLNVEPETLTIELEGDGRFSYRRFGQVTFTLPTGTGHLSLFWINGYGGGIFLPFGDATNRHTTYGAGRYLYDTIKGADLGATLDSLVLDFNYAYNPSCAYNERWVCPLAPRENRLDFPIPVGEKVWG
ncbi:MAG: DUF1684 domain-containing protein [Anaerolineae bacterium]|nr:DUF1684 domain-containing protein [Anaerolineae bacterium]